MKNKTHSVVNAVRGKLSLKIQRHESWDFDARAPPMTGPIPLARATTEPYYIIQLKTYRQGWMEEGRKGRGAREVVFVELVTATNEKSLGNVPESLGTYPSPGGARHR